MSERLFIAGSALDLPLDLITESNGILGKKGSGKTSAGVVLYEEMFAAGVPVVAVDPKGDWYGIRSSADGKNEGLPVPVFGGRHGDIPLESTAGAFIADLILARHLSCVLDVSEFSKAELRRFMIAFADRLYRAAERDPMHLFLEECHEYIPQIVSGEDAKMVSAWEKLVKQGRFKGIGVTLLSQRAASVNKNVLTQIDNLFVMRTVSAQDRAAVKGWIEYQASSADILATLGALATGECWLYQPARDEPVRFRFRMRHTFDAGATPKVGEKPIVPTTLADVDLTEIAAAMAETLEKAKADDPRELRRQLAEAKKEIARLGRMLDDTPAPEIIVQEVPVLDDATFGTIEQLISMLENVAWKTDPAMRVPEPPSPRLAIVPRESASMTRTPRAAPGEARGSRGDGVELRAGARRMVEALGRMAPLRLTKSQWGTVAKLKTSGGTWSTYMGDIRRAGLLDENSAGFTLTEAGFEYLGGRPAPMSALELQGHYRSVLRSGAAKMLDALIDAFPAGLSKDELGAAADISTAGGTFSTYLGDLTRNGLAVRHNGEIVATEILMFASDSVSL
jgi:hypothetical protein